MAACHILKPMKCHMLGPSCCALPLFTLKRLDKVQDCWVVNLDQARNPV